jgi:hypothetical protein
LNALIDAIITTDGPGRDSGLLRDLLSVMMRSPRDEEAASVEEAQPILRELTHHIFEALQRGELRRDIEPERLAGTILTSVFGVIVARQGAGAEERPDLELMIDLLLHGMGPERSASI